MKMVEVNLYPNRAKYYENKLKHIEGSGISQRNKELLKQFGNSLLAKGTTGEYTVAKRWSQLLPMAEWLNKDFDKATVSDLQQLVIKISKTDKSEETKADYRRSLKQLYAWFEDSDERLLSDEFRIRETTKKIYKYLKKDVSLACKKKKIDPDEVINETDLQVMLEKGCSNLQEKAIISLTHEIGGRVSEIFSCKIKHFKVNKRGIGEIYLPVSKTEQRTIHIINSVSPLLEHLKNHPFQEDKEFTLFYYKKKLKKGKTRIETFNYGRIYSLFRKIAKKSGINKKSNPHWYRHSRASIDSSSTMPVDVRCKRMGWSIGSKQLRNYTHISDNQVKSAWLKDKGIEEEEEEQNLYINCSCQRTISSSYNHCPHCGRPTTLEVYEKERKDGEELLKTKDELMNLIPKYKNPEAQEQFIETLKLISKIAMDPKLMNKFNEFKEGLKQ
jgi:integrase/recombinase XerD